MKNAHVFCLAGNGDVGKTHTLKAVVETIQERHLNSSVLIKDDRSENNVGIENLYGQNEKGRELDRIAFIELEEAKIVVITGGDPSYCVINVLEYAISWLNNFVNNSLPKIVICAANTSSNTPLDKISKVAKRREYCLWESIQQSEDKTFIEKTEELQKIEYKKQADKILDYVNLKLNINI